MRSIVLMSMFAAALGGCAQKVREASMPEFLVSEVRETRHANGDDLLSAGLGLDGLRAALPAPVDPPALDATALRRRAIYSNWHGIADLAPGGGLGDVYGAVPDVPGREYSAFAKVSGASQPHRVLAQVPDAFDRKLRCLVVTPVSGSRGVYGSIAFAGAWALPRGCAIVYTDKGAGSGWFDADTGSGVALDGTRADAGRATLEFQPKDARAGAHEVLMKHANSGDNPEADWGRHVIQAMAFGLHALDRAFPELAPFTPANTRVLAFGLSNGGGAVLRAAELPEASGFAAVVAAAPNIYIEQTRPLYDYTTEAALLQPCALLDPRMKDAAWPVAPALLTGLAGARCASLERAGLLHATTREAQAAEAYDRLRASGWDDAALKVAPTNVGFDVWRAVGAAYLPAYARLGAAPSPCGHVLAALGSNALPRATTPAERALWWSDGSGLVPSLGVGVAEPNARLPDPAFAGLHCLRAQWDGAGELSARLRAGVAATVATGAVRAPIVAIVHGVDDGLIPPAFTSRPYAARAHERAPSATVRLYEVEHAQHFDAFLGLPSYADRYLPLIPFAWRALDLALEQASGGAALPPSARVATTTRATGEALARKHLGSIETLGNTR